MTATQFLLVVATIWVAPHCPKPVALIFGGVFVTWVLLKKLGGV
jgi:hypothetical protein